METCLTCAFTSGIRKVASMVGGLAAQLVQRRSGQDTSRHLKYPLKQLVCCTEADSQLELTVQPIKKVRTIPATPKAAYSKRPGIRRPVVKLPEPWVAVEHQGTVYYWNNETEESRWCLPEGGVQLPDEHTTGLDAISDVPSCITPIPQIKQDCLPCLDEKGLPKTTNVASRHLTTSMHHDKRKLTDTHPAHMPEVDADHKARSPESQHSQQYHQSRSERGAVPHKCEASQERKVRSLELQHSKVHCQPQSPTDMSTSARQVERQKAGHGSSNDVILVARLVRGTDLRTCAQ